MELQLCELAASAQRFTWMNNREEEDFVMERLDKAFASVDWVNSYSFYALKNLPILRLYHGPVVLDLEMQQAFRRPFSFEKMWLLHPNCIEVAQHAWSLNSSGSRAYRLICKLINEKKKKKKKEFRLWNRTVFGKGECETPGTSVYSRLHQNNGGYLSLEEG